MIRPLRRQHRVMMVLLTVILAVLFVAGLMLRKPAPVNPQIPNALLHDPAGGRR